MPDSRPSGAALGSSRFIAFLDECGDHSMGKIDADFPIFLLAMVVLERAAYREEILPALNSLKLRYWNHEGVNLHSREIRTACGPFRILQNASVRNRFMGELSALVQGAKFTLFITAIRKDQHMKKYGARAINPYDLALEFTLERVVHFLECEGERELPIVPEARGKREDAEFEQVFYRILSQGTAYRPAEQFRSLTCPLSFQDKKRNIGGIQLADLCAYPCARKVLDPSKPNPAFEITREHIYTNGSIRGWKVFP